MLTIGDWVTQYSAGYWKIIDIKDKYADCDMQTETANWKKGDSLGQWVILKKGFTPKMKPSIRCEFVDALWCKELSETTLEMIDAYFAEHPDFQNSFNSAEIHLNPMIVNCWIALSDEEEQDFNNLLSGLPESFSLEQFWSYAAKYKKYITTPPANFVLNFSCYPWNLDIGFNQLFFKAELQKIELNQPNRR
ncbi:MAG: hypothetical protein IJ766_04495 [Clostridia bacterium]|nr:hypothetical protein [Clostridia bacterium]